MKFTDLRSQFSVYFLAESSSVLSVESDLSAEEGGYKIRTFSSQEQIWEALPENPPHVFIFENQFLKNNIEFLGQLYEKSPETLNIAIVQSSGEGIELLDEVYDFIPQAYLRKETLLKAIDRACENLSYLFKIEQLVEISETSDTESAEPRLLREIGQLSATPILDPHSMAGLQLRWLEKINLLTDNLQIIQALLQFFRQEAGVEQPLCFFKYVTRPSRFALVRADGLSLEEFRGIGFHLKETLYSKDQFYSESEISSKIRQMVSQVFSSEKEHVFPFFSEDTTLGFFLVPGGFTHSQHVDLFRSLLGVAQMKVKELRLSFENSRQTYLSRETGLLNREAFEKRVVEEISRSRRQHTPVSLVLLSIDQFKDVKRRSDDSAVKKMLQATAKIISQTSRVGDVLADLSQGDFAILLPETDLNGSAIKAEKIRRVFESANFPQAKLTESKKMTVSMGAAEYPRTSKDSASLFQAADDALFFIRKQSGNQVCVASTPENFLPDFEVL